MYSIGLFLYICSTQNEKDMKTLKLVIGIVAVVTAIYSAPRPKAFKPFHSFEASQRAKMSVDSMEFENKMLVWSK